MQRREKRRTDGIVEGRRQLRRIVGRAVHRKGGGYSPGERHRLGKGDRFHTRYRTRMLEKLAIIVGALLPGVVASGCERDDHAQRVLDLNAGIYSSDGSKAFPNEAG